MIPEKIAREMGEKLRLILSLCLNKICPSPVAKTKERVL